MRGADAKAVSLPTVVAKTARRSDQRSAFSAELKPSGRAWRKDRQKLVLRLEAMRLERCCVNSRGRRRVCIDDKQGSQPERVTRPHKRTPSAHGEAPRQDAAPLARALRGESAQAGELPAVRESEVMPTILAEDDECARPREVRSVLGVWVDVEYRRC